MTPRAKELSYSRGQKRTSPLTGQITESYWTPQANLFDLSPHWEILFIIKTECSYEIFAELLTPPPICPRCKNSDSLSPNGTQVRSLLDQSIPGRYTRINFLQQRYQCSCGRNLLQPISDNFKTHTVTTRAALQIAASVLIHSYEYSASVAGISAKRAKNIFADVICDLEAARTITLPQEMGIDGVCVGRGAHKKSYCLLTDITNHTVIELLSKNTELEVARFLKQVPGAENLKVIVIDMAKGFLAVIKKLFPNVVIVIDAYHVLRLLNDAVTNIVKTKQAGLTESEIGELMKGGNRFLLLKRRSELTDQERIQLNSWFEKVPEFKVAFDLKEEIFDIWRINQRFEAEKRYDAWLNKLPAEFEKPFRKFTGAVKRWRAYIFNYFDHRVTNAFTESKNRDIKTLQRLGRRTSFTVLRARLLYADALQRTAGPLPKLRPGKVREIIKRTRKLKSFKTRDPKSYVGRMDTARKSTNVFSKLLRPPRAWDERFNQYSCDSKDESPQKWDFLW